MKKTILIVSLLSTFFYGFATPPVSDKVIRNFAADFPGASEVRWHDEKDYTEVFFKLDEMVCRLQYDVSGTIKTAFRYYYGSKLNPFLKAKIARQFPGKTIYGVTEITNDKKLNYYIIIEDEKNLVRIRVDSRHHISVMETNRKVPQLKNR